MVTIEDVTDSCNEVHQRAIAALIDGNFSPMCRRILRILGDQPYRRFPPSQLADILWADDPDGGPETAFDSLRVHIHRLRALIKKYGLRIDNVPSYYDGGGYQLKIIS